MPTYLKNKYNIRLITDKYDYNYFCFYVLLSRFICHLMMIININSDYIWFIDVFVYYKKRFNLHWIFNVFSNLKSKFNINFNFMML